MTRPARYRPAAVIAAIGFMIVLASPVAAAPAPPVRSNAVLAAVDGTLCGTVTDFTAPTLADEGSITVDGTTDVIEISATALIDATTLAILVAAAAADLTLCLTIDADGSGNILDIGIAATAEVCGRSASTLQLTRTRSMEYCFRPPWSTPAPIWRLSSPPPLTAAWRRARRW